MYCGVDLTEIERIAKLSANPRFLSRVYRAQELSLAQGVSLGRRAEVLAGRFAAKEAAAKALLAAAQEQAGEEAARKLRGQLRFTSIATMRHASGAPHILLFDAAEEFAKAQGLLHWQISLSHTKTLVIAMVTAST